MLTAYLAFDLLTVCTVFGAPCIVYCHHCNKNCQAQRTVGQKGDSQSAASASGRLKESSLSGCFPHFLIFPWVQLWGISVRLWIGERETYRKTEKESPTELVCQMTTLMFLIYCRCMCENAEATLLWHNLSFLMWGIIMCYSLCYQMWEMLKHTKTVAL